jgi:hypothetical protein
MELKNLFSVPSVFLLSDALVLYPSTNLPSSTCKLPPVNLPVTTPQPPVTLPPVPVVTFPISPRAPLSGTTTTPGTPCQTSSHVSWACSNAQRDGTPAPLRTMVRLGTTTHVVLCTFVAIKRLSLSVVEFYKQPSDKIHGVVTCVDR